jgi:hypothetical protein
MDHKTFFTGLKGENISSQRPVNFDGKIISNITIIYIHSSVLVGDQYNPVHDLIQQLLA